MERLRTAIVFSGSEINSFCLFDSSGRKESGISVADGTLVLIKFEYLSENDKYIQVAI